MFGPPILEFVVESIFRGKRIDSFLERHLRSYTPFQIHRLVRAGCVWINDVEANCHSRLRTAEQVRVRLICPPDRPPVAAPLPVSVIYEDAWLVVINKPPGQMSHPGGMHQSGTLLNVVQHHLDQQTRLPGLLRPGIVHRIDRQTSGAIVVSKNHWSHRQLTVQFEQKLVNKSYRAIVYGRVDADEGRIQLPIGQIPNRTSELMCAKPCARDPKEAETIYRVLERFADYTFVEAKPRTGRHHQIRIHFAEIGHPLLADEFYGAFGEIKDGTPLYAPDVTEADSAPLSVSDGDDALWDRLSAGEIRLKLRQAGNESRAKLAASNADEDDNDEPAESDYCDPLLPLRRHALHAATLSFTHPVSNMPMSFDAPLPPDLSETLEVLRSR